MSFVLVGSEKAYLCGFEKYVDFYFSLQEPREILLGSPHDLFGFMTDIR